MREKWMFRFFFSSLLFSFLALFCSYTRELYVHLKFNHLCLIKSTEENILLQNFFGNCFIKVSIPHISQRKAMHIQLLATSCEELAHWKRVWCWEGLGAGGEGDDRGWDGWMASRTRWTWVWVNSRRWWWTGRSGVLWFMGSDTTEQLNWTELSWLVTFSFSVCCVCPCLELTY